MDIQRKNVGRKKAIRWHHYRRAPGRRLSRRHWSGVKQLKPAAPGVELSTLWPDTVRRGPMVRDVRGLGTLVPEDTLLITATTDGRSSASWCAPGTTVRADTVVMVMSSPQLETAARHRRIPMKGAEADYDNLKVTLAKTRLDLQSQAATDPAPITTPPSCRPTAIPPWQRTSCWFPRSMPRSRSEKAKQLDETVRTSTEAAPRQQSASDEPPNWPRPK